MVDIRFGIIGTGWIAEQFVQATKLMSGACVKGVSSRDEEKGRTFATKHDISKVYHGTDALVNSDEIDAIYVAVPHNVHFENCLKALKAGKHVLCEKPMCISKKEAQILFEEARNRKLFLMEGMWSRLLPNSITAKKWIDQGSIGNIRFIDAMFTISTDLNTPGNRMTDPKLAGGAMYDLGVYTIEMSSYYAGNDPVEWKGLCVEHSTGVDVTNVMIMSYPKGILATTRTGMNGEAPAMLTIYGDKGRIELPRFFAGVEAKLYIGNECVEILSSDTELPMGFVWEIDAVCTYIRQGTCESSINPASMTIRTAEIMESMMNEFFPGYLQ